jgi:hypothetical protein
MQHWNLSAESIWVFEFHFLDSIKLDQIHTRIVMSHKFNTIYGY